MAKIIYHGQSNMGAVIRCTGSLLWQHLTSHDGLFPTPSFCSKSVNQPIGNV